MLETETAFSGMVAVCGSFGAILACDNAAFRVVSSKTFSLAAANDAGYSTRANIEFVSGGDNDRDSRSRRGGGERVGPVGSR